MSVVYASIFDPAIRNRGGGFLMIVIGESRLAEAKENVLHAFEDWVQTNNWLFCDDDPKKQKKKDTELKKIRKLVEKMRRTSSLPELLAFVLWCQNYVCNFGGVAFGVGIHGDPVKSFYTTNPRTELPSSLRLAQAIASVLRLQC